MTIKLSKSDKIILANLEWNSKIKEKELAKKCNLSKDGIRYRIKRLENKQIITRYGALIDYKKIGKESYKTYLKTQDPKKDINTLRNYFKGREEIFAIFESKGIWNIALAIFANNSEEYYLIENEILNIIGDSIINKKFCQMVNATINTNKSIFEEMKYTEQKIWNEKKNIKLDKLDEQILKEITINSKITLHELSEKTKKSIDIVMRKKKKLEQEKIIAVYNTTINYPLIDVEIYKIFLYVKKYNTKIENKLLTYLKTIPQLRNIIRIIGPWKLEIELSIKKYQEYEQIVSQLNDVFKENIKDIEYAIFRNETFNP